MIKSILVVGMGRFGTHLARKLLELKNQVMIVDKDENLINNLSAHFSNAQIGDCTNEVVLRSLGVSNFDICFVTIGDNFQSSLEITSLLKELGAKRVVSKANRDIQAKFLLKNGADEVVYLERDMAEKLAVRHSLENIFDYIELTPEYSIFEIPIPTAWVEQSIAQIGVRAKYHLSILAIKRGGKLLPMPQAHDIFIAEDHVMVMGKSDDVSRLTHNLK